MANKNPFWLFGGMNVSRGGEPQGGMRDYLGSFPDLEAAQASALALRFNPQLRINEELHWWHIYDATNNKIVLDKTYGSLVLAETVVLDADQQSVTVTDNLLGTPVQYVRHKGLRSMIVEHGELLCESCDCVFAHETATVKVGDVCWRCHTPFVGYTNQRLQE